MAAFVFLLFVSLLARGGGRVLAAVERQRLLVSLSLLAIAFQCPPGFIILVCDFLWLCDVSFSHFRACL
jgi:hypothetical protein